MGQLRAALRAYAIDRAAPGAALEGLDHFIQGLGGVGFATVAITTIDPVTGDAAISLAGHPPPVLRRAGGAAQLLDLRPGAPIGAGPGERPCATLRVEPGDLLLGYTDGLVERRDRLIDDRLSELCEVAAGAPAEPEAFADRVLTGMLTGDPSRDDTAVVVVRRV